MRDIKLTDIEADVVAYVLNCVEEHMNKDYFMDGNYTDGGQILVLLTPQEMKALRRAQKKL